MRQCLRVERFRPRSCRRRYWHSNPGHLRADQPLALGSAQSARGGGRNFDGRALPALPQADLPAHSPSLHDRHLSGPGAAGGATRAGGAAELSELCPPPPRASLLRFSIATVSSITTTAISAQSTASAGYPARPRQSDGSTRQGTSFTSPPTKPASRVDCSPKTIWSSCTSGC